jgi:hypothetical protein
LQITEGFKVKLAEPLGADFALQEVFFVYAGFPAVQIGAGESGLRVKVAISVD